MKRLRDALERAKNQIENCFPVIDPEADDCTDPFEWAKIVSVRVRSITANLDEALSALAELEKPGEEEPLSEMSRKDLQLNIMRNIEREIMTMYPKSSFAYWWKHTVNWHKVQTFINGNTSKMGATSSAVQCRFIGANPDGKSFLPEPPHAL